MRTSQPLVPTPPICHPSATPWVLGTSAYVLGGTDPEKGSVKVVKVDSGLFGQEILGVLSRRRAWGLGVQ